MSYILWSNVEESELIRAAQAGDEDAFAALISRYTPHMKRIATLTTQGEDTATEIVQLALIKVWRFLPSYQAGNFRSWVSTIVRHTSIDQSRRKKQERFWSLDEMVSHEYDGGDRTVVEERYDFCDSNPYVDPEWVAIQNETYAELASCLDSIAPERSALIRLSAEGYMMWEMAEMLKMKEGTIKSRLSRGREELRQRRLGYEQGQQ